MEKTLIATKTELKDTFRCHSAKLNRGTFTVLSTSNTILPANMVFNIYTFTQNIQRDVMITVISTIITSICALLFKFG